ncbi:MAG TPA: DUF2815 family protein [Bacillota bacterium]
MSKNNPQHVVTGKVRLSFVHLFQPYANPNGGEPKYSTMILLPKSDTATKARIDAAIQAAITAGVSSRWNGVRPPQLAIPIYDGDGSRPSDGMPFSPECKGHWVFTASSKQAPQIVDVGLNPIINQSEIYSGVYARVSVQFFPYANSGKKGIGCGLGNVQKLEDGEPLGGRTSAADDFAAFGPGPAPAPAAQPYQATQQQYQYQPQQPAIMPQYQPVTVGQNQFSPAPTAPQQQQMDPITGRPIVGGIMGI